MNIANYINKKGLIIGGLARFGGIVLLLIISTDVYATKFFVDTLAGNDSFSGTSHQVVKKAEGPWKSISRVNKHKFKPGDEILFRRGNVWRESLIVPSSGSEMNPIIFGAYGDGANPTISAAEDTSTMAGRWIHREKRVWSLPLKNKTKVVIFNSDILGRHSNEVGGLGAKYQWHWKGGFLFVYAKDSPETYYHSIEIGKRHMAIFLNNMSHIVIQNIDVYGGSSQDTVAMPGGNIVVSNKSKHVTIENLVSSMAHGRGLYIAGAERVNVENCIIKDIDSSDAGNTGDAITITWWESKSKKAKDIVIRNNHLTGLIDRQGIALIDVEGFLLESNRIDFEGRGPSWAIDIEPNQDYDQGVSHGVIANNIIIGDMHGIHAGNGKIDLSGDITIKNNKITSFTNGKEAYGVLARNMGIGKIVLKGNIIRGTTYGIITTNIRSNLLANTIISSAHIGKIGIEAKGTSLLYKNNVSGFKVGISVKGSGTINSLYNNNIINYEEYGLKTNWESKIYLLSYCNTFSSSISQYHISSKKGDVISSGHNEFYPDGENKFQLQGPNSTGVDFELWRRLSNIDKHSAVAPHLPVNRSIDPSEMEDSLTPLNPIVTSIQENIICNNY